jgi:murein DD-endopeptidase MepM/ murein hydrolase activator NlpD
LSPRRLIFIALVGILVAACQARSSPTPTPDLTNVARVALLTSPPATWTLTPRPTTPTPAASNTPTPSSTFVVFATDRDLATPLAPTGSPTTLAATHTPTPSPTFVVFGTDLNDLAIPSALTAVATATASPQQPSPTCTATFITLSLGPSRTPTLTPLPLVVSVPAFQAHFLMARPFSPDYVNWASRNYPYGSTAGGTLRVHHGVDTMNPAGTPVRAVAEGTVVYAGSDTEVLFGPQPNFYGKLVVIEHDFTTAGRLPVYTLYGHLSRISVESGQRVNLYQQVGLVGSTGVAEGAHLHFEVRAGDPFDYNATRNPDLWLQNFRDYGVLAGRVTNPEGELIYGVNIELYSATVRRNLTTYAGPGVPGDDQLNENFAIGDLPEGNYSIAIRSGGCAYRNTLTVYRDRVNWIEITLPSE